MRTIEEKIYKAFKALGEPTRLKIIKMLSLQSLCVCELSEILDMLQPRISQHLRILKEAGLIREKKEGYWVCYSLNREYLDNLWETFNLFLANDLKDIKGYEDYEQIFNGLSTNERIKNVKKKLSNPS